MAQEGNHGCGLHTSCTLYTVLGVVDSDGKHKYLTEPWSVQSQTREQSVGRLARAAMVLYRLWN